MGNNILREKIIHKLYQGESGLFNYQQRLKDKVIRETNSDLNNNRESIEAYNKIIESTAKLCHELKLKDSLSIFTVFNYLLWNGYFSKDKKFIYSKGERKNSIGCLGLDIINGKGVCLNNAKMLEDLYRKMNYESYMVITNQTNPIKREYKPNIERKAVNNLNPITEAFVTLTKPFVTPFIGSHACTLVRRNDVYYTYDPTKLCVYKLDDFLKANIIGGKGNTNIKPFSLLLNENSDNKKVLGIVDSYKNFKNEKNPYNINDIKNSFEDGIHLCKTNSNILNDYHNENANERAKVLKIFTK